MCLKPALQRVMVPSPDRKNLPFQDEMPFILRPLDLRCLVVEAAAEPIERRGKEREEGETRKKGRLRRAVVVAAVVVPAPLLLCSCCCCCCPQKRRLREKSLLAEKEEE